MNYSYENNSPYALLRPYLQDGEEVLWVGKPYTSTRFVPNVGTVIFSIFWLSFALFWTAGASAAGGAFGLFGLPFIGVGCFLLYNTLFGEARKMKKTTYAVTDRRAIVLVEGRHGVQCTDYHFAHMQNVTLTAVRGETGSILFPSFYMQTPTRSSRGGITLHSTQSQTMQHGFYMIDSVHTVYRLISEQIHEQAQ